jgi:hypothetical protein
VLVKKMCWCMTPNLASGAAPPNDESITYLCIAKVAVEHFGIGPCRRARHAITPRTRSCHHIGHLSQCTAKEDVGGFRLSQHGNVCPVQEVLEWVFQEE